MISKSEIERLSTICGNIFSIGATPLKETDNAKFLIGNYTGLFSTGVNPYLRKRAHEQRRCYDLFECLLNKALDEINGFNNQVVYRMDNPGLKFDIVKF